MTQFVMPDNTSAPMIAAGESAGLRFLEFFASAIFAIQPLHAAAR